MSAESEAELRMQIAHLCPKWSPGRVESAALFSLSEPGDGLADEKTLKRHIALFDSCEPTAPTTVRVPVSFYATYEDGRVTKLAVTPCESDAGYFGWPSQVWDGDDGLDVASTDGPFWNAMRDALGRVPIEWEE